MVHIYNLVVAHTLEGKLTIGSTPDFNQGREAFHIFTDIDQVDGELVYVNSLKALFFVKTLQGNPNYRGPVFSEDKIKELAGMKLRILFKDGEVMYVTSEGYSPARSGFFAIPIDRNCNNEKMFVNSTSTESIKIIR